MGHVRRVRSAVWLTLAASLVMPAAAGAQDDAIAQHVAEHEEAAIADAIKAAEGDGLSPVERAAVRARARARRAEADAIPPEQGGAWSPPFDTLGFGEHASLLPSGKVLAWGLPWGANGSTNAGGNAGNAWLWDPALGNGPTSLKPALPPLIDANNTGILVPASLHCASQSFLPDGRLLVMGGNMRGPTIQDGKFAGLPTVFTFNPWNEQWARQPDMADGRWYPSQVLLADGTTYVVGGLSAAAPGSQENDLLEKFTPSDDIDGTDGVVEQVGPPDPQHNGSYPRLFALPGGGIASVGPGAYNVGVLDPATGVWDRLRDSAGERLGMSRNRGGGNAVIKPGTLSTVMTTGGFSAVPGHPTSETSESIDFSVLPDRPAFQAAAPMNVGRKYHNTVLLPDGSMVAVGGGSGAVAGVRQVYDDGRGHAVELWSPEDGTWRLGAAQVEDRGYHSTALLLPDGRVMSAGDDALPSRFSDTIEIYSPPYLFRGGRPSILEAPTSLHYDRSFRVRVQGEADRAVLMAPGATTHGVDMAQRYVELDTVDAESGRLRLRSPAAPELAVPGYYMLFVLNDEGVPSVAEWVRLGGEGHAPPPSVPIGGSASSSDPPSSSDAPPGPPAGDGAPSPRDGLPPAVRVRVGMAARRAALRTRRLRFRLSVDEPATIDARLAAPGAAGTLGRLHTTVSPGTSRLALVLPRRHRRALRHRRLTLVVTARDDAGNTRRVRVRFRLR